jgi:Tfp pilus assembly protein PilX
MPEKSLLKNEEGSVIVLALVMLVLLTLLGISATSTSTIEVQIAANEHKYKDNLYKAEGAVMESAQILENSNNPQFLNPNGASPPSWLYDETVDLSDAGTMLSNSTEAGIDSNAYFAANAIGIGSGDSLDINAPTQMHEFKIYGLYSGNNRQSQVVVGYKKRY